MRDRRETSLSWEQFYQQAGFTVFLYRPPLPSESISSLPNPPKDLSYVSDLSRTMRQQGMITKGLARAIDKAPLPPSREGSISSESSPALAQPIQHPSPPSSPLSLPHTSDSLIIEVPSSIPSTLPNTPAPPKLQSTFLPPTSHSLGDDSSSPTGPHQPHSNPRSLAGSDHEGFPFIIAPFQPLPTDQTMIDSLLPNFHYKTQIKDRAWYLIWLLKEFRKLNEERELKGEPLWFGFILQTPTQQICFEHNQLQHPGLSDGTDWWLAARQVEECKGEQGLKQFSLHEKDDPKSWTQWAIRHLPNWLGVPAAFLATGKPLIGVSGFLIYLGLANTGIAYGIASIGALASFCFYLNSNRNTLNGWFNRLFARRVESIQRKFPASKVQLLPPLNRTPIAYICDLFLGAGYATSNFWMVLATQFFATMPYIRYPILGGILWTNLLVGIDKSSTLTKGLVAFLDRFFGKRNPALAVEDDLLTSALEHFNKALEEFDQVASQFITSPANQSQYLTTLNLGVGIDKIDIEWIKNYLERHLRFLKTTCFLDEDCPLTTVLKDVTIIIQKIEQDTLLLKIRMAEVRQLLSQPLLTSASAAPDQASALLEKAYTLSDQRCKKFTFQPHFVGDNGKWRTLLEWTALTCSWGISILGAFSNISGNYGLWSTLIASRLLTGFMSIFCTLSVIGLNKEISDIHMNWLILKKTGQKLLRVSNSPLSKDGFFRSFCYQIKASPSLVLSFGLSFIQAIAGAYYCIDSHIASPAFRWLCGGVTFYTMLTTKLLPTQKLLTQGAAKLGFKKSKIPTLESNKILTEFHDAQIHILTEGITRLVNEYNRRLRSEEELDNPKLLNEIFYKILSALRIRTVVDREVQLQLQLKQLNIRKVPDSPKGAYSDELQRQINITFDLLKQETSHNEALFAAQIRPQFIDALMEAFSQLSFLLQCLDQDVKISQPGELQEAFISADGRFIPPQPLERQQQHPDQPPPRDGLMVSTVTPLPQPNVVHHMLSRAKRVSTPNVSRYPNSSPPDPVGPRANSAEGTSRDSTFILTRYHAQPSCGPRVRLDSQTAFDDEAYLPQSDSALFHL